jgi:ABC-type multidrug transport system fused ATPase/permease subunit
MASASFELRKILTKPVQQILGRQVLVFAAVATAGTLGLVVVEASLAASILLLLNALGIQISPVGIPHFLRDHVSTVSQVVGLLVLIGVCRFTCQFFVNFGASSLKELVNFRLRRAYFYRTLLHDRSVQVNPSHANFVIGKAIPVSSEFSHQLVTLFTQLLQAVGIYILMLKIAPQESISVILLMAIGGATVRYISGRINQLAAKVPSQDVVIFQSLQRILRNWIFVRIMRLEDQECRHLVKNASDYRKSFMHFALFQNLNFGLISFIGVLVVALLIYFAHEVLHTESSVLISFLYLVLRFVTSSTAAIGTLDSLFVGFHYAHQVAHEFKDFSLSNIELIDSLELGRVHAPLDVAPRGPNSDVGDSTSIPSIDLHQVSFRYAADAPWVFENLTVHLAKGQQLGIVGPSGGGKSTLLGLILGLQMPTGGSISINSESALGYLEKHPDIVGYVGPDPFIIGGSVRQNLLYGLNHKMDDMQLWQALTSVALDKDIRQMTGGLDYHLTENADGLSVGQKQRLAIARALLRRPKLLVLDECSSNLDDVTERVVSESLNGLKGQMTMLIVAHRKGILQYADKIVDLEQMRSGLA